MPVCVHHCEVVLSLVACVPCVPHAHIHVYITLHIIMAHVFLSAIYAVVNCATPKPGRVYILMQSSAPAPIPKKLHFQCNLQVLAVPVGNQMLVFNQQIAASPDGSHLVAENVVDAQTIPGMQMESIIQQVSPAMHMALPAKELALRKQIATKVLITMGADVYHFEQDLNQDGILRVDWHIDATGPNAFVMSHAVIRIYTQHTMVKPEDINGVKTGSEMGTKSNNDGECCYDTPDSKVCYLLGCTPIDLAAMMQHSLDVNTGKVCIFYCMSNLPVVEYFSVQSVHLFYLLDI